jgi:Domain of unknown function (DU1801)
MTVKAQIKDYIGSLPETKRSEIASLHQFILKIMPAAKLWFLDGRDSTGKIVSNPNIGYGEYIIQYANGISKPFYQVGLSANTSGISVYIMGLADKNYLAGTYGKKIGKAAVSGYCIKFKKTGDINLDVLQEIIKDRYNQE